MGESINFKQYQRGVRNQTIESDFSKGMNYTNAPLTEGYSRVLVNYDINSNGSLQPRAGFVKKDFSVDLEQNPVKHNQVLSSATISDNNGNSYQHTILGGFNENNLYQVVQPLDTATEPIHSELIPTAAPGDATEFNLEDDAAVHYITNKPNDIHGYSLDKSNTAIQSIVGCRAYNNDFYYFQGNHLCHAGYLLTKDATETTEAEYGFVSQRVEPKICTPSEVTTTGFNMLASSPYSFTDTYDGQSYGGINPIGIVAYEDEECTKPIMTPSAGQHVWLKCYMQFPEATFNKSSNSSGFYAYASSSKNAVNGIFTGERVTTAAVEIILERLVGNTWTLIGRKITHSHKTPIKSGATTYESCYMYSGDTTSALYYKKSDTTAERAYSSCLDFNPLRTFEVSAFTPGSVYRCRVYTINTFNMYAKYAGYLDEEYATVSEDYEIKQATILANYPQLTNTLNVNKKLNKYTLSKAAGMVYWKDRLIVWGVPEDKTMLFISDIQNPSYFPYPNNTDAFTDPIVAAVPLLDYLIIFTTTECYTMVYDATNMLFIRNCIQRNLKLSEWDRHLIQPIKNMLFFKSGNYYYMIVPKAASTTGELTIAPISKNIINLFDNFKNVVYKLFKKVYNYNKELPLIHYYNFLDFEDVVNNYVFLVDKHYINFMVVYNSVDRNWLLRVIETPGLIHPIKLDATQRGIYSVVDNGVFRELGYSSDTLIDSYCDIVQNYQYYDSGFREHTSNLKKRYREYQLIVDNLGQCEQEFNTGFYIDNDTREQLFDYIVTPVNASTEQGYAIQEYFIDAVPATSKSIPATTLLTKELGAFKINNSMLPEVTTFKLRFHTSGKGYAPRMVLFTNNCKNYALISNSYIYRLLYSR